MDAKVDKKSHLLSLVGSPADRRIGEHSPSWGLDSSISIHLHAFVLASRPPISGKRIASPVARHSLPRSFSSRRTALRPTCRNGGRDRTRSFLGLTRMRMQNGHSGRHNFEIFSHREPHRRMTLKAPREPGATLSRSPSARQPYPHCRQRRCTKTSATSTCLAHPLSGMMGPSHGETHQLASSPYPPTRLPARPSEHLSASFLGTASTLSARFSQALRPKGCSGRLRWPTTHDPSRCPCPCRSTRPSRRSTRHRASTPSLVSASPAGCRCRRASQRRDRLAGHREEHDRPVGRRAARRPRRARPGSSRASRR